MWIGHTSTQVKGLKTKTEVSHTRKTLPQVWSTNLWGCCQPASPRNFRLASLYNHVNKLLEIKSDCVSVSVSASIFLCLGYTHTHTHTHGVHTHMDNIHDWFCCPGELWVIDTGSYKYSKSSELVFTLIFTLLTILLFRSNECVKGC